MFLTRLFKWILIVLLVLAVTALVVVWPVLGVNPFEGRQEHLWSLASNQVDFFVRFPGTRVLEEPLIEGLVDDPDFEALANLKDELRRATADVARQVNPKIPFGLLEVDLNSDFLGREMALAGAWQTDYSRPRLDNFIFMTRVADYARFISALKRGFVRRRIQGLPDLEVEKGLYFKVTVDGRTANALRPYRSVKGRPGGDNTFYLARIKDVLLFSDTHLWIEDAIHGGVDTLPADAWFESEFIATAEEGRHIEIFARPQLTANLMLQHTRGESRNPLNAVKAILPPRLLGELTLRLSPVGKDEIQVSVSNVPEGNEFAKVDPHLQTIYEHEKGNPAASLSESGIGRFIPKERGVGAIVLYAEPEEFIELALSIIPRDELRALDEEVRDSSKSRYMSFKRMLSHVAADLGGTHMLIVHRPPVFEKADFSTFRDTGWPPTPAGQFSFTLVSRVKDNVAPDKVRERIFQNLQYVRLNSMGTHKSGKFHLAQIMGNPGDLELLRPSYGVLGEGKRFVIFSSSVEAAEAVYRASEDPDQRLLADPGVARIAARMPREASLAAIVTAGTLQKGLFDFVRSYADARMDRIQRNKQFRNDYLAREKKEPTDQEIKVDEDRYVAEMYPKYKREYEEVLGWLDSVDAAGIACSLGVGSEKKVKAWAWIRFLNGE
ncbi:MAG: hypothetical protein ACYSX0_14140 [Planctomycetota bacterium]|jgi:hypothetical protein